MSSKDFRQILAYRIFQGFYQSFFILCINITKTIGWQLIMVKKKKKEQPPYRAGVENMLIDQTALE